jgi:predicted RecB family nuclease
MPAQRICPKGHKYYKSNDCPTCPICEKERAPEAEFVAKMSAPARRALEAIGVRTLEQLARHTEKELLALHGFGPASMPVLKAELKAAGLSFKK